MNLQNLREKLKKIHRKGYKKYKEIEGEYLIEDGFYFKIEHVQGDPFASPSKLKLIAYLKQTGFPKNLYNNFPRKLGFQDFILRNFKNFLLKYSKIRGSGKSGLYFVDGGNQKILYRSACEIIEDKLILRFFAGLPAHGRTIDSIIAEKMLIEEIPNSIKVLKISHYNIKDIENFVNIVEDQEFIRDKLKEKKIIAFIGNNSILPRSSGVDDTPLKENIIFFKSPKKYEIEFKTLHHGIIKGMGIPEGVVLIVGGGFHGKSTLLNSISHGVYNHIPNDGREWVITNPNAVKVRSEDGRYINGVNISSFINNLPMNRSTQFFSTENASGSTSIAANIVEAIELGAEVLLIDEDTTATNFLIRDSKIQLLVPKEKEPITPFIDRVKELYEKFKISTIMVIGGSGDYLSVADYVISMENYIPVDKTEEAKKLIKKFPIERKNEITEKFQITSRIPLNESFNSKLKKREKVKSKGLKEIIFGKETIDVSLVEQLIDDSQTRCIGEIIKFFGKNICDNKTFLKNGLDKILKGIYEKGFLFLMKNPPGNLALPRIFEIGASINRLRSLKIKSF